jgi:hypothetical protein
MGGIGKTTISTWLVRQEGSRRQFEQIVWLTLGQEPNLPGLQALLYVQLTGSDFEGDPTPGAQRKRIYISFAMPFYTYSFYQDRLGTNITREKHSKQKDPTTPETKLEHLQQAMAGRSCCWYSMTCGR